MISPERAEKALHFLIDSDEKLAKLEGELRNAETRAEIALEIGFLEAQGANIREREAKAKTNPKYLAAESEASSVEVEVKTLKYQRKSADDLIDVWRSQESSRRQGV